MKDVQVFIDEEETEFLQFVTKYIVIIKIPKQDPQQVLVIKDDIQNLIHSKDKVHPAIKKIAIDEVKNHIAKLYSQSDY